ncbi:MAG: KUP/HAK/KT family potassium transporter, partial [Deltaproteobacteria bacterium]|nr:KUP/HAK/KT family potassium transporter [Deltaproteobacteria bacterium]
MGESEASDPSHRGRLWPLAVGAIGVVYGDIGTSPLYAFRECFSTRYGLQPTEENILGLLSLIFWSLVLVVSVKYIGYLMTADNRGEGGILALMTLVLPKFPRGGRIRYLMLSAGILGAALFYGDAMITPAISVLSALEGLEVAAPLLDPFVIPLAIVVLLVLFAIQRRGTGAVGALFGPIMVTWFGVLALLGARQVAAAPAVLAAIDPRHAGRFFLENGSAGFLTLGAVFLVVTGGEALYADMGHFGKRAIRFAWFALVLPSLLLNYFGQAALILADPASARSPFYLLAPAWALYPLIGLATAASVIASQAVISGAFSITRQAIQLGYCPRMVVRHSSEKERGQVYVPWINWFLLIASVGLILGFGESSGLAAAYGAAVVMTMLLTTLIAFARSGFRLGWRGAGLTFVLLIFLVIDTSFFSANVAKAADGAWLPLLVGSLLALLMITWNRGRRMLRERIQTEKLSVELLLEDIARNAVTTGPGTAVFMDASAEGVPRTLLHNLKHNRVLHERIILLTILTADVPRVAV